MVRRIVHVTLLLTGFAPAVWGLCIFSSDQGRAAVLLALAGLGLALNATALARPTFGMRIALRVIAAGVALIVLAAVMAMWQWIRTELLPGAPCDALARDCMLRAQCENLLWIAAAVGYVLLTVVILPVPGEKRAQLPAEAGRIDFRTFGR